ncbi:MAG: hypothetical protein ACR2FO_04100 [Actinomycetota bacterium]
MVDAKFVAVIEPRRPMEFFFRVPAHLAVAEMLLAVASQPKNPSSMRHAPLVNDPTVELMTVPWPATGAEQAARARSPAMRSASARAAARAAD